MRRDRLLFDGYFDPVGGLKILPDILLDGK